MRNCVLIGNNAGVHLTDPADGTIIINDNDGNTLLELVDLKLAKVLVGAFRYAEKRGATNGTQKD